MDFYYFILANYFLFIFLSFSVFGLGFFFINQSNKTNFEGKISLSLALGLGVLTLITLILLLTGFFSQILISFLFLIGLILGLTSIKELKITIVDLKKHFVDNKYLWIILILSILNIALKPLRVPLAWDELNYHLPHAKAWAENNFISININYRYPFFPYNFDILYSIPLLFGNDVFPKFIHGFAGIVSGLLIYSFLNKKNLQISLVSLILWLIISRGMYEKAYVELGLTMFITSSIFCFYLWEKRKDSKFFLLATFFAGLAVGVKYQSFFFLPGVLVFLILNRNIVQFKNIFCGLILFLIPCIYWYLRNYLITGNPVNPIAPGLFGFYDWNQDDYDFQFFKLDTRKYFSYPFLLLFFGYFLIYSKKDKFKSLFLYTIVTFFVWLIFSGFGRYLYAIFPLLCFFTAHVLIAIYDYFYSRLIGKKYILKISKSIFIVLIFFYSIDTFLRIDRASSQIPYSKDVKESILTNKLDGYTAIDYSNKIKNNVYQFRMEHAIYYFRNKVYGEVFGPWRYSDYLDLDPQILYKKLLKDNIGTIVVSNLVLPSQLYGIENFENYFDEVFEEDGFRVYKLKEI